MTHIADLADEFLLSKGFTIFDPGPGMKRTARRGSTVLNLEPRCPCECCPRPTYLNYRFAADWGAVA